MKSCKTRDCGDYDLNAGPPKREVTKHGIRVSEEFFDSGFQKPEIAIAIETDKNLSEAWVTITRSEVNDTPEDVLTFQKSQEISFMADYEGLSILISNLQKARYSLLTNEP